MHYAVVIAGGGPAGGLAALKLARTGVRVLVVDRERRGRVQAAEIMSPDGRDLLHHEDVWNRIPLDFTWPCTALATAWDTPGPVWTRFDPCAWHIDRLRFDAWLLTLLQSAGATVVRGTVDEAHRVDHTWRITCTIGPTPQTISADTLIVATGRSSRRLRLATRAKIDNLCLVAGTADSDPVDPDALVVEAVPDGWWYSAPLVGGRLFTGWMTDFALVPEGRYVEAAAASLAAAPVHTQRLSHLQLGTVFGSATWTMAPAAGPGWIAIGDAALARDPIGGDGLTSALRSACHAADVVRLALDGDDTAWSSATEHTATTAQQYVQQRFDLYRRAQARWPASPFWARFAPRGAR